MIFLSMPFISFRRRHRHFHALRRHISPLIFRHAMSAFRFHAIDAIFIRARRRERAYAAARRVVAAKMRTAKRAMRIALPHVTQ
jgi:KaiC/GvpD/RAD55 family RecA-like ATPase